jgi:hypothetical protein
MNALINLVTTEANIAYENSAVSPRLRVVHKQEVVYSERPDFGNMLADLQDGVERERRPPWHRTREPRLPDGRRVLLAWP